MSLPHSYSAYLLILLVVFGFGWGLGQAPLFDEDEGFFAEGTREMALRNDFVSTYINQEARYDKPPLTNWLQYLSTRLLGWTEQAMRLPSALAAMAWMAAIYLFTRRRLHQDVAYFATLMATCSLQITIVGKAALADSLLNATLAAAMFCLYQLLTTGRTKYVLAFYALTGLGFLTKGPIAVLVPGAVALLYLLRWREWRPLLRLLHPGLLLFLLIALPWYILQYQNKGQAFLEGFFMNHNLNRFQTAFEGHYGGILYFVPVLLLGLLPFTAVILKAFSRLLYLWNDRLFSFLLLWFVFIFVFFSLSGTKLHHYIIYGYTPLCILGGWYTVHSQRLPLAWPLLVLLLILTAAPFLMPQIIPLVQDAYAVDVMRGASEQFDGFYVAIMIALMAITLVAGLKKNWDKKIRMAVVGFCLLVTINLLWMPRLGALLQEPVKEAALLAKQLQPESLVVNDHYNPSFHFYSGLFAEERKTRPGDVVFTRKNRLADFPNKEILYEKYGLVLARIPQ